MGALPAWSVYPVYVGSAEARRGIGFLGSLKLELPAVVDAELQPKSSGKATRPLLISHLYSPMIL